MHVNAGHFSKMAEQEIIPKGTPGHFSVVVITLALGAVILLIMLLCGVGTNFMKKKTDEEEEPGECSYPLLYWPHIFTFVLVHDCYMLMKLN